MTPKFTCSRALGALTAVMLAGPSIVAPLHSTSAQAAGNKITWYKSFESAMKESKRTGKPMFVDFYATWCAPCKIMDSKVFTNPKVISASRDWVAAKVNIEKRPDLARKYRIESYPTIGFFSPRGKLSTLKVGVPLPNREFNSDAEAIAAAPRAMLDLLKSEKRKITRA